MPEYVVITTRCELDLSDHTPLNRNSNAGHDHNDVLPADKECRSRKLQNKYHFAPGQHFSSVLCLSTWGFSQKNVRRIILGKVQMQEFHVIRWHQCSVSLDSGITTWSQFNKNYTRVLAGIFSKLNQTPGNELDDTLTSQKTRLTSIVTSTTLRCQHVSLQLFTLSNPRNWNR